MKKSFILNLVIAVLILASIGAGLGCDAVRGGAEVWLENVAMGSLTMDGKPVQGIPTSNINAVLKVSTNKVYIKSTADGFVMRLSPSNAVITSSSQGLSITGLEPDQIELKFQTDTTE